MARNLHRAGEIVLEARCQRVTVDFHDALVRPATRIDRHGALRAMGQVCEVARHGALRHGRHAAHIELARNLHDEHRQRAAAEDLQRDGAVEFQALGDQPGRRRGMSQRLGDECVVVMIAQHATPGARQVDERAAHGQRLEAERCHGICGHVSRTACL